MTGKLVRVHPACERCTIAEAAARKIDGHDLAPSLTHSIKAPIHFSSLGFYFDRKFNQKGRTVEPEYTTVSGKANYAPQSQARRIDVTLSHFVDVTIKHLGARGG